MPGNDRTLSVQHPELWLLLFISDKICCWLHRTG